MYENFAPFFQHVISFLNRSLITSGRIFATLFKKQHHLPEKLFKKWTQNTDFCTRKNKDFNLNLGFAPFLDPFFVIFFTFKNEIVRYILIFLLSFLTTHFSKRVHFRIPNALPCSLKQHYMEIHSLLLGLFHFGSKFLTFFVCKRINRTDNHLIY